MAGKDIKGLENSEVVLGLLDGTDAGTLFEVGYAIANGKPTIGYADDPSHPDFKMLRGMGTLLTDEIATAVYQTVWAGMVEA